MASCSSYLLATKTAHWSASRRLFFTQNRDNLPALLLLGSIEISDYLDFIVRTSELNEFAEALLDLLASEQAPAWQVLDLIQPARFFAHAACPPGRGRETRLGLFATTAAILPIHPSAR